MRAAASLGRRRYCAYRPAPQDFLCLRYAVRYTAFRIARYGAECAMNGLWIRDAIKGDVRVGFASTSILGFEMAARSVKSHAMTILRTQKGTHNPQTCYRQYTLASSSLKIRASSRYRTSLIPRK